MIRRSSPYPVPAGDILVSVLRRGVAAAVDLALIGLPILLGALDLVRRTGTVDAAGARVLAIEAAVMTIAYHTIGVAWTGKTVGKAVMQCRVVRLDNGGRVTASQALIRALVVTIALVRPDYAIPALLLVYGWAWFDPRQQGLHDRAAGTIVVLD